MTVKPNSPGDGTPVRWPAASRASPGGKAPALTAKAGVPTAPDSVKVTEAAAPPVSAGTTDGARVTAGGTASLVSRAASSPVVKSLAAKPPYSSALPSGCSATPVAEGLESPAGSVVAG